MDLPVLLLVDDNRHMLDSVVGSDYAVHHVTSLNAAVAAISSGGFEAIILDIGMRGLGDWATALGRLSVTTATPIIVWSATEALDVGPISSVVLQAGADEAIDKRAADLGPRLRAALIRSRARATRQERSVPRQLNALTDAVTRLVDAQEHNTTTLTGFMESTDKRLVSLEASQNRGLVAAWKSLPVSGRAIIGTVVGTSLFAFFVIIVTPLLILAAQNGLDMTVFLPLVLPAGAP